MSLVEGPIFQVAWVVDDIAAGEQYFGDKLGVEKWLTMPNVPFSPEFCTFRGEPAEYVIDVSIGYSGGQQLELIRPVSGANLYAEFLEHNGPGIHHVGWVPDDYEAALARARELRIDIPQQGGFGELGMEFAYLEGGALGSYVELMFLSPTMRAMFDSLVPKGFSNPWQVGTQ